MTATKRQPTEYLPTPPREFWDAWLVVRNYLLFNRGIEVFRTPPVQFHGKYDLKDAFWRVDYYYDMVLSREEEFLRVE